MGGGITAVMDVSLERFEALVAAALDAIPEALGQHMDNVVVQVSDQSRHRNLLGLYEGVPLTARGNYGGLVLPDRITVYRLPILAMCRTESDVVDQVRTTVVHEVAHHFGIDDARLRELGYG